MNAIQREAFSRPVLVVEDVLRLMAVRDLRDGTRVCLTLNAGEP